MGRQECWLDSPLGDERGAGLAVKTFACQGLGAGALGLGRVGSGVVGAVSRYVTPEGAPFPCEPTGASVISEVGGSVCMLLTGPRRGAKDTFWQHFKLSPSCRGVEQPDQAAGPCGLSLGRNMFERWNAALVDIGERREARGFGRCHPLGAR